MLKEGPGQEERLVADKLAEREETEYLAVGTERAGQEWLVAGSDAEHTFSSPNFPTCKSKFSSSSHPTIKNRIYPPAIKAMQSAWYSSCSQ